LGLDIARTTFGPCRLVELIGFDMPRQTPFGVKMAGFIQGPIQQFAGLFDRIIGQVKSPGYLFIREAQLPVVDDLAPDLRGHMTAPEQGIGPVGEDRRLLALGLGAPSTRIPSNPVLTPAQQLDLVTGGTTMGAIHLTVRPTPGVEPVSSLKALCHVGDQGTHQTQ